MFTDEQYIPEFYSLGWTDIDFSTAVKIQLGSASWYLDMTYMTGHILSIKAYMQLVFMCKFCYEFCSAEYFVTKQNCKQLPLAVW